jgi:2-polyprenyl-6-methoxyphenol hydroxylase-like FAD-dependent oxidoreductase
VIASLAYDGGRSTVRRQLGIKLEGSTFAERWLIIDLEGKRTADLGGTASTEELTRASFRG